MEAHLPHLVVRDLERQNFTTAKKAQIPPPSRPERDRNRHSTQLRQQLEQAWVDAKNDEVIHHTTRKGIYLEFKGDKNHQLVTKSLESISKKDPNSSIRLLNVRTENGTTYATVFTPKSKHHVLTNKIISYASKETSTGKPQNAPLIESISEIRKALEIESFWLDQKNLIPKNDPEWCEVWLSSDQKTIIEKFEKLLRKQQINSTEGVIRFPERAVKIIHVNRIQLETITKLSDDIAEYRRAKETAAFWLDQNNKEQAEWVETILERLEVDPSSNVSVCILDTGVNSGHPLIAPALKKEDCQSVYPSWGTHDHDKHGTLMAGVSAYGNLQEILTHDEIIRLKHCIESVKILPPKGATEPKLWGYVTAEGISKAEIQSPKKNRISCMAVTSDDTRDEGRPSSWSAELDQICSGVGDDIKRLFIVSSGNSAISDLENYPSSQLTDSIHDPAQSWNALTVGAYTQLDQITDSQLAGYKAIAPAGGLSPFSTTSWTWDKNKWPIKPEIVMEGGNLALGPSGFSTDCDDLSLLSTYFDPQQSHFYPFNMTSAATAQAAWFAAQLQTEYPEYWPETIRGLMVHSAKWTNTLKGQFLENEKKGSYERLLRICGYGVPDLERAKYSAKNSLTLVAQSELQPFKKEKGKSAQTNIMHLYELPWPKDALQALPPTADVEMRITLSYFIEPGPGEIGWQDRYRYASHGLRFDLNAPLESKKQFEMRINKKAQDDDYKSSENQSVANHWTIGQARNTGSIHSDIWAGTAAQLAESNLVAVYPTIGWWKQREHLEKWDSKTRYTLIVSINTPEQDVDIYTPVATQIGIKTPIQITT
ncbi:MAG: S8 family peptidase [Pontiellaceae bacterium]|nr:S8 family peptidase [Pontiellaceae bacterium]